MTEVLSTDDDDDQRSMGASVFGAATSNLCHDKFCVTTNFVSKLTGDNHHLTHLVGSSLLLVLVLG